MGNIYTGTASGLAGRDRSKATTKTTDFFDDPVLNKQYKDLYAEWANLSKAYFDSSHGINDTVYLNLDEKGKGRSRQSVKDVLENVYKEALAKGEYKEENIRKLSKYKDGIEANTGGSEGIFTDTGTPSDELGLGKDRVDKGTILAQLRDREMQLDRMKQMQGYRGTPRTDTTEKPQDSIESNQNIDSRQNNNSNMGTSINKGTKNYSGGFDISDSLLQYKEPPNLSKAKAKAWDTLDPTNLAFNKQNSDNLGTSVLDDNRRGVQFFDDGTHINSAVTDAQIDKVKQRRKGIDAELSNPNILPERKQQLEEIKSALDDGFGADIAKKDYRDAVSGIRAFDVDKKDQSLIIPSQVSNIAQLDSSFMGTLNQLMEHDKAQGKLSKGLTAQQVIDGAMGSQYIFHDLFGDEYADFRDRHKEFFDEQKTKRNELTILNNAFLKGGGYKGTLQSLNNTPADGGEGQSESRPKLKGVKVPFSELNWSEDDKRITEDLTQGASNVTFGALGTVIGAVEGFFGASYQNQRGAAENVATVGSTIGRGASALHRMPQVIGQKIGEVASGMAPSINPVNVIADIGNKSGWL
jgi:hypothetical protein